MICFAFVLLHAVVFVESGILVTSPRLYRAGSTQVLTVSLFSEPLPWIVNATLAYSNRVIDTDEAQFTSLSDGTLKLKIPRALIGQIQQRKVQSLEAKLTIHGGPLGGKLDDFQSTEMITITIPKISIFIQTDKPIYKPGQTVNIRVIGTDENLRPLEGKISRLTVKNPSDVRLMQWDDLDFVVGIVSLKFPLSSQPGLGDWKIEAVYEDENKKQTFKVDKYVLPKYEVTIKPPPFVARFGEKNITARICARYTYGQPVIGKVFVSFGVKLSQWARESQTTVVDEINGCKDISVKPHLLGLSGQPGQRKVVTGHSPWPKLLVIKATVRETATNVSLNATDTETEVVRTTTKLQFLTTTPKSFKQGMPLPGQVLATFIDGTPLKGVPIEITVKARTSKSCDWDSRSWSRECKQVFRGAYIVPADGIVNFVVPGSSISQQTRSLKIKASYQTSSAALLVDKAWSSPSNSFVEMARLTSPQMVGSTAKVTFTFSAKKETKNVTFHYQVFSRGKLVAHGRKLHMVDYKKNMTTFTNNNKMKSMFISQGFLEFNVTHEMVPSCRLLLFYVREDKETVAATMQFDTEASLENEVKIQFADTQRQPGEKTRLIIKAAKGSKVAITAVDRSVHLLEEGNELSEADAIKALRSQDVGPYGRDSCPPIIHWPIPPQRGWMFGCFGFGLWYRPSYIYREKDLDSSKAFKDSGVIYFSDLKIKTAKCRESYRRTEYDIRETSFSRALMTLSSRRSSSRRGGYGSFRGNLFRRFGRFRTGGGSVLPDLEVMEMQNYDDNENAKQSATKRKPVNVCKEFPETWLWTEHVVNESSSKMELSVKVPDTITSWVASAFAMSNSSGLGISKPTSLKVFQPFFVSLTLPYSVIRGEEVSVIATVFNYENKCLTIRLSLEDSLSYRITSVHSHDLCVCSNEAKSVNFGIVPKVLGQVPLSLFAKDINNSSVCGKDSAQMHLGVRDAVIRKLLVEPEGVRQEYTYSTFVCLKDTQNESYFKDDIKISLPDDVVPGSVNAIISTIGDLMGPTLKVDSLLRLPYGCGEQNMVNFAPSIYIMKYLSSVEQLSESIENKAKNIMRTGYQRELTYKRNDGSYSAFGKRDSEGNMWLTAFVLRSFAQAQPFIFVDSAELRSIQTWITGKQQSDGCFPKHGRLFNKLLKGGVTTEATLTAFVTISLLESGMSPANEIIQGALNCLNSSFQSNLTDSYTLSLFAYTFTLAKDPQSSVLFTSLKEKAIIEGRLMHWEKVKEISNSSANESFWWKSYFRAPAADIEMTSYALMTYVLLAEDDPSLIGEAMPIVRWLTKQRNALGGFASTQDTCVALQALSKYATKAYSDITSLTVQIGNKGEQFRHKFIITEENRMISQRAEVPSSILPIKKLPVKVNGEGCALIQADVSYNIPDVTDEPAFSLNVTLKLSDDVFAPMATQSGELLCLPLEMFITAEWLKEGTSNMAVVDVKLVSGYLVDEDSLKKLLSVRSLGIKRYEMEGQHVILYLDEIDKVSFSFKIYQSAVVKKTKPAAVTVYDYYETDLSATKMYKITEDLCGPDEMP